MGFVGALIVFAAVFGGYIAAGGNLGPIFSAAPLEIVIIFGAALGAYVTANPMKTIKMGFKLSLKSMTSKGPQKKEYLELMQLLFQFFQLYRKEGPQGIEPHVEEPEKSSILTAYPSFMKNHHAVHFLCDTVRVMLSADLSQYDIDDLLDADMKAAHEEEHAAQHAIQQVAEALPGLGIVAAVLGIIKTMSYLNAGTEKIGALVGAALVGTMLGVFGAYGFAGPIATKIANDIDAEGRYLAVIKAALVSFQKGSPPIVCVEYARRSISPEERPSFEEVEKATKEIKKAAA